MDVEQLRGLPPLDGISEEGLLRVAACAAEFTREAGQVLALPDDPGSGMYMIREGTVAVELRTGTIELGPGRLLRRARAPRRRRDACRARPCDERGALRVDPARRLPRARRDRAGLCAPPLPRACPAPRRGPRHRLSGADPSLHSRRVETGLEPHRGEPPRAARLPPARPCRGGRPADRDRGQVAPRGRGAARPGVRRDPRRRGLARRRIDRRVRAGERPEPSPRAETGSSCSTGARSTRLRRRCTRRA